MAIDRVGRYLPRIDGYRVARVLSALMNAQITTIMTMAITYPPGATW